MTNNTKESANTHRIKKGDFALLFCIILFSTIILLCSHNRVTQPGSMVCVTIDNRDFAVWPLSDEITTTLPGSCGTNQLRITNGTAFVSHADCPDQICVRHKPITQAGERIVCLPNKVVITISGSANPATVDGVSR